MTLLINSNISSLNAQRQLNNISNQNSDVILRVSSGSRINSAKDDSAGLAISDRLTAQLNGFDLAARNTNNAVSYALTAETGLSTSNNLLQRIRTLATQASNASLSHNDRVSIQQEVVQLTNELHNVTDSVKFNGYTLLDGSQNGIKFQVGANSEDTLAVTIDSIDPGSIGRETLGSSQLTGATTLSTAVSGSAVNTFAGNQFAAQNLSIASAFNGKTTSGGSLNLAAGSTAAQIAAVFNGLTDTTGVTATASTSATISGVSHVGQVSFQLFGSNSNAVTVNATVTSTQDLSAIASAINAKSSQTNVTAVADRKGNLVLTEDDGHDIGIKNQGFAGTGLDGASFRGADTVDASGVASAGAAVTLGDVTTAANTAQVGGSVEFDSSRGFVINTDTVGTLFGATASSSKQFTVAGLDLTTASGATDALKTLDAAINTVSNGLASIGSLQNRLELTIDQLQVKSGALASAKSRISDTDYASESARLTRTQILQQASVAVLTQANSLARNVLTLLR